ncbi:Tn3 family transposase [Streptomyces sp. NPDC056309]|uniref:Tn3 family transposase n=1 Tax=unclassified Streptomyces TaxID=2593676 RepID=UPI0035D89CA7
MLAGHRPAPLQVLVDAVDPRRPGDSKHRPEPATDNFQAGLLPVLRALLQSALVHINTLLLQQVLAEPEWAKKLSEEDRRGLMLWSNINPYGTFRLGMDKRLDLALSVSVPRLRGAAEAAAPVRG